MLREILYLGAGVEKKVSDTIKSLIDEGKEGYEDKDLIDVGKEHIKKRKSQVKKLFLDDFKSMADELGLATKEDIDELKNYIKNKTD